jgi:hypothetical protein
MNKIQAFFRKHNVPKNAVLQDVAGNEFDFGDEIEDLEQVEVGTTATLDGAPASGEYPFPNGKTYVFVDGVVTEIRRLLPKNQLELMHQQATPLSRSMLASSGL